MTDIVHRVQQSIDSPAPNGLTIAERREVVAEIDRLQARIVELEKALRIGGVPCDPGMHPAGHCCRTKSSPPAEEQTP